MMSPLTLPATIIELALIWAVITALSPITRLSFALISPSTCPSIRVAPSNNNLPLIFDPASRYARPSTLRVSTTVGRFEAAALSTDELGGTADGAGAGETCGWGWSFVAPSEIG